MLTQVDYIRHTLLNTGTGQNNIQSNYSFFHNQDSKQTWRLWYTALLMHRWRTKGEMRSQVQGFTKTQGWTCSIWVGPALCFLCVNEWKSVFCCCFMMKRLQETTLTSLPTLCTAFQFQVTHPESAATYGIHATLVDHGACFRADSFSFKSNESDPAPCLLPVFPLPLPLRRDYTCLSVLWWTSWMTLKPQAKLWFR